jgi:hypothetical protein
MGGDDEAGVARERSASQRFALPSPGMIGYHPRR